MIKVGEIYFFMQKKAWAFNVGREERGEGRENVVEPVQIMYEKFHHTEQFRYRDDQVVRNQIGRNPLE
jgi:hypothetical protein